MKPLSELVSLAQDKMKIIHITGTNGKGSTCLYAASILRKAGYKVGTYMSTGLTKNVEIAVDGVLMSPDEETTAYVELGRYDLRNVSYCHLALLHFLANNVDVAIIEANTGGLNDQSDIFTKTNVVVITYVGLDHVGLIGDTLYDIAQNKAGIIKSGSVVLTAATDPAVLEIIDTTAKCIGAERVLHVIPDGTLELTSKAHDALINATLAMDAVNALGLLVDGSHIADGLAGAELPGRFEVLPGTPTVVLDGSKNADSLESTMLAFADQFPGQKMAMVYSSRDGKDQIAKADAVAKYADLVDTVIVTDGFTRYHGGSVTANLDEMRTMFRDRGMTVTIVEDCISAIDQAKTSGKPVVACGSIPLVGVLRDYLVNGVVRA